MQIVIWQKKNENNSENVENQIPNDIKNISLEEWRKVIALFYKEHYGYKPDNITCTEVGPNIIYVTIYHNTELVAEYTLDAGNRNCIKSNRKNSKFL